MTTNPDPRGETVAHPVVTVPEIRDYTKINAQVVALLNAGHRSVSLEGVDGQRLLLFALRGSWTATVEVDGDAGPELAAEMDAPNVLVRCRGSVADGAARGLIAGRLHIGGRASAALGYTLRGGCVILDGDAGPRLGLEMQGGAIVVGGNVDRLAGERQQGGLILVRGLIGPLAGLGRRGGRLCGIHDATAEDLATYRESAGATAQGLPSLLDSD